MRKKNSLLMVGGGLAEVPLIASAKKLGYTVFTTGNKPDDLGHSFGDGHYNVDFSDCDAIYQLAGMLDVKAICPGCNDFAALSSAYAAEKLGIPGHDNFDTAVKLHHKDEYRKFALSNGIPSPWAKGFSSVAEVMESRELCAFPVIVKPVDLTGGKGISVVSNKEELYSACQLALLRSKARRIVVEEFIDGSRHGFSAFLQRGKVTFYFSDNEYYYLNPYLVSAASTPSTVDWNVEQKLCLQAEKIASLLELNDGIFHVQYILKNQEPIIIEICRRPPGDLYIKLVEFATGVDYPGWIIRAFSGQDCSALQYVGSERFITRHCIMSKYPGRVRDIVFDEAIDDKVFQRYMFWEKGQEITDVMTAKFGIVFLEYESIDEMINQTNRLNELISVHVY